MAKRTYKTEKAGPASTNKLLIPKTFDPSEDSNISTGAQSQPASEPFKSVVRPLDKGGRPDKGPQGAETTSTSTGLTAEIGGLIGAAVGTVTGFTGLGLIGAGIGAAISSNQAEKDLEARGLEANISGVSAFNAGLSGGFFGQTSLTQSSNVIGAFHANNLRDLQTAKRDASDLSTPTAIGRTQTTIDAANISAARAAKQARDKAKSIEANKNMLGSPALRTRSILSRQSKKGSGGPSGGSGTGDASGFCFDKGTMFKLDNGTFKAVEDFKATDNILGGTVLFTLTGDGSSEHWYDYRGVHLTGEHPVFERGIWKRVEASEDAVAIEAHETYYTMVTTNHRLVADNGVTFTDDAEHDYDHPVYDIEKWSERGPAQLHYLNNEEHV